MNPSLELGLFALADAAAKKRDIIRQLAAIAQGLASVHPDGITVADVRAEAARQCILPKESTGRQLSFLGAVMREAGLEPTGEYRRSDVDVSHGNLHRVWKQP